MSVPHPRVVVVGAGLAGLSAAVELVDRNFNVTLIEAGPRCGGKLSAWQQDGRWVEHGIHGWWPNYVNLWELLQYIGIPANSFQRATGTVAVLPDASTIQFTPLALELPSPLFLIRQFLKAPYLGLADVFSVVRAGLAILAFRLEEDFHWLDVYTFKSWLWRMGVSRRLFDYLFEPYVRSFAFDSAARISAAAVLSSFHLYVVRHGGDILPNWLTGDPQRLIIEPLRRYIEGKGGRILLNTAVRGVSISAAGLVTAIEVDRAPAETIPWEPSGSDAVGRVRDSALLRTGYVRIDSEAGGVWVKRKDATLQVFLAACPNDGQEVVWQEEAGEFVCPRDQARFNPDGSPATQSFSRGLVPLRCQKVESDWILRFELAPLERAALGEIDLTDIPTNRFRKIQLREHEIWVGRWGQKVSALSAICTHAGCLVNWQEANRRFSCPCHGASFNAQGDTGGGPATRPLDSFELEVADGKVRIFEPHRDEIQADYFVIATDVESAKKILPAKLRKIPFFRAVDRLGTTPLLVVRLWFKEAKLLRDLTTGAFLRFSLIDNFFVLSNVQPKLFPEGTVLEVQAYDVADALALSDDVLARRVLADLRRAFPVIRQHRPEKIVLIRHPNVFTYHVAGSNRCRPTTQTPVPNLFFAGDWVGGLEPYWNMERAVVSGKVAAGEIIRRAGGVGPYVLPTPRAGRLLRLIAKVIRLFMDAWRWLGRLMRGDPQPEYAVPRERKNWRSCLYFGVYKFRGQPNEQFVTGFLDDVEGEVMFDMRLSPSHARGSIRVGLESVKTGVLRRDNNIRDVLFRVSESRDAMVLVNSVKELGSNPHAPESLPLGIPQQLTCEATLKFLGREIPFNTPITVVRWRDIFEISGEELVFSARSLSLDLAGLLACCGVTVDDTIQLSFRLVLPYRVRRLELARVARPANRVNSPRPAVGV